VLGLVKTALIFFALVLVGAAIWLSHLIFVLTRAEFTLVAEVFKRQAAYEAIIEEANISKLDQVVWGRDFSLLEPPRPHGTDKAPDSFNDAIIEIANSNDFKHVFIKRFDNGWIFEDFKRENRQDTMISYFVIYYGNEPTFSSCDDIDVEFAPPNICFGFLFGDWYFIRELINRY
jgi:hypothetical protein